MKKILIGGIVILVIAIGVIGLVSCDDNYVPAPPSTDIKDVKTLSAILGGQYALPVEENLLIISVWGEKYHKYYRARYYESVTEAYILGFIDGFNCTINIIKGTIDYDYCTREYDEVSIKFGDTEESVSMRVVPGTGVINRNITCEFFYKSLFYQVEFEIPESKEPSLERVNEAKESAIKYISNFMFY